MVHFLKSNCLLTFKRVPSTCNSCPLYYICMHTSNTAIPANKFLGKLCPKGHDWNGTGKSLRFVKNAQRCVQCEKERRSAPAYKERRNKVRRERYQQDHEFRERLCAKRKEQRDATGNEYSKRSYVREKHKAYMKRRRLELGGLSKEDRLAKWATRRLRRHLKELKVFTVADLILLEQERYNKEQNSTFGLTLYNRQKAKLRKAMAKGNSHFGNISRAEMIKRWNDFDNSCAYCGYKPLKASELEVEHVQPISQGGPHTLSNIVPACKSCNMSKHKHDMIKWYRKQPFYDKKREAYIKQVLASTPYPEQQLELLHQWQVAG